MSNDSDYQLAIKMFVIELEAFKQHAYNAALAAIKAKEEAEKINRVDMAESLDNIIEHLIVSSGREMEDEQ